MPLATPAEHLAQLAQKTVSGAAHWRVLHEMPRLDVERSAPVVAAFVIVYLAALPAVLVAFLLARTRAELLRLTIAVTLCIAAAGVCFALYPTTVPRDRPELGAPVFVALLHGLYGIDPPRNACPSLHVAVNAICALSVGAAMAASGRRWLAWSLAAAWIGLVWASTVLTGQHALVDGACGLLLGAGLFACTRRFLP